MSTHSVSHLHLFSDDSGATVNMARPPVLRLYADELVVDNFAGGGGASTGIKWAIGRDPDIAINHDAEALAMYRANHPTTRILREDVFAVNPRFVCGGKRVGLAWFSPDCTFHSKARGGKPFRDPNKARRIRGLAGVVLKWAADPVVRPRIICVENVEEFQDWGPIDKKTGKPDPARKGIWFKRWCTRLRNLGYQLDKRELRACDFGAPTSRKRLFIVARCDGESIAWPTPTHGPGRQRPFRTAAECIDWSRPCPSIFERKKPLADATLRRIARGIKRYVLEAKQPFIVPLTHQGDARTHSIDEPMRTITGANRGEHALVSPVMVRTDMHKSNAGCAYPVEDPLRTVTTGGGHAVVAPLLAPVKTWGGGGNEAAPADRPMRTVTASKRGEHALVIPTLIQTGHGERPGQAPRVPGLDKPLGTVVATAQNHALVSAFLSTYHGEKGPADVRGAAMDGQLPTQDTSNRHALVSAFLAKHYGGGENGVQTPGQQMQLPIGTVTGKDHHAVVACHLQRDFGASVGAPLAEPHPTVTAGGGGKSALVASSLVKLKGTCRDGQPVTEPLGTVQAQGLHYAEVRAFLIKYYGVDGDGGQLQMPLGTVTTRDRFAVVTVHGVDYAIVDIGMRMLTPRELFLAQGFPPDYVIDPVVLVKKNGRKKRLTKTAQVHKCGNSVSPYAAKELVLAQVAPRGEEAVA